MTDYKIVKAIRNGQEYCFPAGEECRFIDFLIVGGGGGGGMGYFNSGGGGGGGGGVIYDNKYLLNSDSECVTVGAGGAGCSGATGYCCGRGCNGGDSQFNGITAKGGGGGGGNGASDAAGLNGGSGGGGGYPNDVDFYGSQGYAIRVGGFIGGHSGGIGARFACYNIPNGGGGGGAGGDGYPNFCTITPGDGGAGILVSFGGSTACYSGGGGGGGWNGCTTHGKHGGGNGGYCGCNATTCGSGGGGGSNGICGYGYKSGNGAGGIVMVRYPTDGSYGINCATGGTVTTATINSVQYKIHTFTSNGTFCVVS